MIIAIVYDHRGRTKAAQEGPVEVRITHERKPYYINTGIKVITPIKFRMLLNAKAFK